MDTNTLTGPLRDQLIESAREVLRISERDHEAWHRLTAAIDALAVGQREELSKGTLVSRLHYAAVRVRAGSTAAGLDALLDEASASLASQPEAVTAAPAEGRECDCPNGRAEHATSCKGSDLE